MSAGLIERLEAATEGSRDLDCAIAEHLGFGVHNARRDGLFLILNRKRYEDATGDDLIRLGEYTTSLDAALALAERVLPDLGPITLCIAGSAEAYIDGSDPCGMSFKSFGHSPALALCIAFLKATTAASAKLGGYAEGVNQKEPG